MIRSILEKDKELFVYLNSKHLPWLDPIMEFVSSLSCWVVLCAVVIAAMIYIKQQQRFVAPLFLLLSIGINSLVNNIVKVIVERPRPIHNQLFNDLIHTAQEYNDSYSFFSGHASNSFCLAVFSLLFFRNKTFACVIVFWAAIVSYSRIYLAMHYPLDVVCGILFGSMIGYLGYKIYDRKQQELG